jgi:hypothetical protein
MVQWVRDYVRESKECREAAQKARDPEERTHLLYMAERWKELMRQRAAYVHLEGVLSAVMRNGNGDDSEDKRGRPQRP